MVRLLFFLLALCAWAQRPGPEVRVAEHEVPPHVLDKLSPQDRALFSKLMSLELESVWAGVTAEGYSNCFINELMPLQIYMRRGQAAGVSPIQMSVDYQVPVRIAGVTVLPGDLLLGDRHGILVVPAAIAEKVANQALATVEREEFQRRLLLSGESLYEVYPNLSEANRKKFEEYRKAKGRRP